jgi:leucyl-tRNA synthetase
MCLLQKRHQGFNVLHPGLRQFWVACKQYAIQTGQRPEDTTSVNIDGGGQRRKQNCRVPKQLDKIGFSFDWSRRTYFKS